jgi:predicted nucleic acid-binding protein
MTCDQDIVKEIIHLLNEKQSRVTQNFRQHNPSDIVLCSVVKAELLYGARRSQRMEANLQLLKAFFAPLQSLPSNSFSLIQVTRISSGSSG